MREQKFKNDSERVLVIFVKCCSRNPRFIPLPARERGQEKRGLFCRRVLSSAANRTMHNVFALPWDGDRIRCDTFRFASLLTPYTR
ncbi:hypothetical protein HOV93_49140 [Planctomycetes bacterium FF15]|uniref:Uncharacterized protein n=1 Tax=Bremerella alba TaxID=980252 RepID=A0A7V9A9R5_9BACT|nr:hypothetical protein [Bremerella alba]